MKSNMGPGHPVTLAAMARAPSFKVGGAGEDERGLEVQAKDVLEVQDKDVQAKDVLWFHTIAALMVPSVRATYRPFIAPWGKTRLLCT